MDPKVFVVVVVCLFLHMTFQLSQNHLSRRLSFSPLHFLYTFVKTCIGVGQFLSPLFCSSDLYGYSDADTTLSWLIGMHAKSLQSCLTLWPHGLYPIRLLCPWDFPGKNGVGCHSILQGIFLTQGLSLCLLGLLHWQTGSLPLAPPGKPPDQYSFIIILEIRWS